MFDDLQNIQSSLSPNNQKLIPPLIKAFTDMKNEIISSLSEKFDDAISKMQEECLAVCNAKDEKISLLEDKCKTLQDKVTALEDRFDDEDAYIRRDSLIFSGDALQEHNQNQNCVEVVQKLLKDVLHIELKKEEISVTHRLGRKPAQGPDSRSITAKFCRRDAKRDILLACRSQKPRILYIKESLTKLRQKIALALRKARRRPASPITAITTFDGRIFTWVKNNTEGERDLRCCINTLPALEDFCQRHLGYPAADLLSPEA